MLLRLLNPVLLYSTPSPFERANHLLFLSFPNEKAKFFNLIAKKTANTFEIKTEWLFT